jgi:ssDNA-binding replication factor A large subunit
LEKFYDVFQENHVYIISKGQLKPANKKFSRLPNEYELTLVSRGTARANERAKTTTTGEATAAKDSQSLPCHRC